MRCSNSCKGSTIPLIFVMCFPLVFCQYGVLRCSNVTTYEEGDTYSTNLNRLLNDLIIETPQSSGFNTSSYGQTPNKVYGLLQCFWNISADQCLSCSLLANNTLRQNCGNGIGGLIWLESCFLRYNNSNFISKLDIDEIGSRTNGEKITNNLLQAFQSNISSLLSNLSNIAYVPPNKGFAGGSRKYSGSNQVYGAVQCLRDLSMAECRTCLVTASQRLQNCCSAKLGGQVMLGSCRVIFAIKPFLPSSGESTPPTQSPPPSIAETPTTSAKKSSKTLPIILGLVGVVILVLVICLVATRRKLKSAVLGRPVLGRPVTLVALIRRKVKSAISARPATLVERHEYSSESRLPVQEQHFIFSLKELAEATDNFDDGNKLGQGGFGAVYKGKTKDGKLIAVKKLSARSTQGKKEFMNEVTLVANVQHRNLVKLMGCCADGDERLLVYEYLPNKSLDTFLFDPEKSRKLDWKKRYNIINGIARGLLYLHEDSQLRIIHRDIKANNILLDDKLNPKIADFGLARLFPEDESHIQTRIAGTYGYMAPEYAMRGQLSVKADVYSFGVLLLEIVSGRKNTDFHLPQGMQNLSEWAWRLYRGGDIMDIVDPVVTENCPEDQVLRCIDVALLCVQADAAARPQISDVIIMISTTSMALPNPTKPGFVWVSRSSDSTSSSGLREYQKGKATSSSATATSSSATGLPSVNETSITEIIPR